MAECNTFDDDYLWYADLQTSFGPILRDLLLLWYSCLIPANAKSHLLEMVASRSEQTLLSSLFIYLFLKLNENIPEREGGGREWESESSLNRAVSILTCLFHVAFFELFFTWTSKAWSYFDAHKHSKSIASKFIRFRRFRHSLIPRTLFQLLEAWSIRFLVNGVEPQSSGKL